MQKYVTGELSINAQVVRPALPQKHLAGILKDSPVRVVGWVQ